MAACPDLFIKVSGKAIKTLLFLEIREFDFLSYSQPEAGPPLAENSLLLAKYSAVALPALCLVFSYSLPGLPKPKTRRIIYEYYGRGKRKKQYLGIYKGSADFANYRAPYQNLYCPTLHSFRRINGAEFSRRREFDH